jgi:hypothetical protein
VVIGFQIVDEQTEGITVSTCTQRQTQQGRARASQHDPRRSAHSAMASHVRTATHCN